MSFEGSLESFGIGEIFQLIASQAKTGVLEITTEEGSAIIRFVRGQIFDAIPPTKDPNSAIGVMLVRADLITKKQLDYALDLQHRNLRRLGDTLIRMGAIRTSEFQAMLALQRRELAFGFLRLRRGHYKFTPSDVDYEEGVDTLMNVDAVLMEGSRQLDEWPAVLKRIPSDKLVFRVVEGKTPPEGSPEEDVEVFQLVNGERTVRKIIDVSRLGEFSAWDSMANLYDGGIIEAVRETRAAKPQAEKKPVKLLEATFADTALSAVALFATLFFLATAIFRGGLLNLSIFSIPVDAAREYHSLEARSLNWSQRMPAKYPPANVPERK
ncbi:DUF4388 domain-containing protein [bacterium]|nr:MAG: DUF4388 domain-containing protein [bacterium]